MQVSSIRLKMSYWANIEAIKSPALTKAFGISIFITLTSLGAFVYIPLPFTPVPITLQTFFVVLSGALLGPWPGFISQTGYLILGSAGLPIFYGGNFGLGHLFGPTGGYILGFILTSWIMGKLIYGKNKSFFSLCVYFSLGMLVILFLGSLQLSFFINRNLLTSVKLGMFPFILSDCLKAIIAASVVCRIKK